MEEASHHQEEPPPLRKKTPLATLGLKIEVTEPLSQAVRTSISCGESVHPFSGSVLSQIRMVLGATAEDGGCTGATFLSYLVAPVGGNCGRSGLGVPIDFTRRSSLGVDELP